MQRGNETANLKRTSNLSNVVFLNPGLPVVDEGIPSSVVVLVLTERPFVNDPVVAGILKERRCCLSANIPWKSLSDDDQALTDPWFKYEPLLVSQTFTLITATYTSEIHPADLFLSIWEASVDSSLGEVIDWLRCRKSKRR
jgi:hypothetical protein